ncbi:MAG: alpha/beta fold hydrolase [Acidimicrobiales bacterium]|nr:alpha/beta fold hydrolase [Acidimicrobiales bacterium]
MTPSPHRRRAVGALVAATAALLGSAACTTDDTASPTVVSSRPATSAATGTAMPDDTAASAGTAPDTADGPADPIDWSACGTGLTCAQIAVPADPADPDGPTVEVAVTRRAATGADVIGPLFVNPGGPGAATRDLVAADWPSEVEAHFDIIGVDPRGVGASMPLRCGDDPAIDAFREVDAEPTTDAGRAELVDAAAAIADACGRTDAETLATTTTAVHVADLDAVRAALGSEQLSFAGFSYGTAIGQAYAAAHPDRVRALLLDGVIDPELDLIDLLEGQALAIEAALDELDARCRTAGACATTDVVGTWDRVEAALTADPAGPGPAVLRLATIAATYSSSGIDQLPEVLVAAERGELGPLERLADRYVSLADYAPYAAYVCRDLPHPDTVDGYLDEVARVGTTAPRLGPAVIAELLPCATWPEPSVGAPGPIAPDGLAPALVIGNTGDRATPLAWAQAVAADLPGAALITVDTEGHTALLRSACVQRFAVAYLVDGTVPPAGTTC